MSPALKQAIRRYDYLQRYVQVLDPMSPEAKEARQELAEAEDEVQQHLHGIRAPKRVVAGVQA